MFRVEKLNFPQASEECEAYKLEKSIWDPWKTFSHKIIRPINFKNSYHP